MSGQMLSIEGNLITPGQAEALVALCETGRLYRHPGGFDNAGTKTFKIMTLNALETRGLARFDSRIGPHGAVFPTDAAKQLYRAVMRRTAGRLAAKAEAEAALDRAVAAEREGKGSVDGVLAAWRDLKPHLRGEAGVMPAATADPVGFPDEQVKR